MIWKETVRKLIYRLNVLNVGVQEREEKEVKK